MIASTQTNHPIASLSSGSNRSQTLEETCAYLKKCGLRVTQPRVAILKALIEHVGPVSIEQIHSGLSDSACDLVTVYRCLAAFENIGIVRRSFYHNGTSLYQLERQGASDYHIINKTDKSIRPLPAAAAAELAATIEKIENSLLAQGYTDIAHSVEFFANTRDRQTSATPMVHRNTNVEMPAGN